MDALYSNKNFLIKRRPSTTNFIGSGNDYDIVLSEADSNPIATISEKSNALIDLLRLFLKKQWLPSYTEVRKSSDGSLLFSLRRRPDWFLFPSRMRIKDNLDNLLYVFSASFLRRQFTISAESGADYAKVKCDVISSGKERSLCLLGPPEKEIAQIKWCLPGMQDPNASVKVNVSDIKAKGASALLGSLVENIGLGYGYALSVNESCVADPTMVRMALISTIVALLYDLDNQKPIFDLSRVGRLSEILP